MTTLRPRTLSPPSPPARGMGALVVIMLVVVMGTLAAAITRMGSQSSSTVTQDVLGMRAQSAARAGIEFGLYAAFKGGWTACASATQTLDLTADLGMTVTVSCNADDYFEGDNAAGAPQTMRIYTIDAVACNGTACPDATAVAKDGYVERKRQVHAVYAVP